MRLLLPLLLSLLVSTGAYAQTPQVDRIDVVEYGIYTGNTQGMQAAPGTATGTVSTISDIQHAATTRTVPAQQGVRFGFRFVVVGAPAGAIVPLHMVTIFPPPGLTNPATQQPKAQSEYDTSAAIGTTSYKGYNFTNDWEVAPGTWTMQIWYQGRKLAEQSFTVVRQ
jgi:Domain of unknown function (DUF3859)